MDGLVALGSNLGDRRLNLTRALAGLRAAGIEVLAVSSVWETEPVDTPASPWFWNMVVEIRTELDPFGLLDRLLQIECEAGRERGERNAPRTLDLDLLRLGERLVNHPRLVLPHPRMWQRRFVLEPLAEVDPGLVNPVTGRTAVQERDLLRSGPSARRLGSLASLGKQPV